MVVKKFTFGKQIEEDTAGTKYQNYVTKFEKFVGDKEKELSDLESIRLEAAILQEDDYSENLQNLICNSKLAGINWKRITEDNLSATEQNVELTESLSGIKIDTVQTKCLLSEDNDCIKSWELVTRPSDLFPECEVETSFKTVGPMKPQRELPSITEVKIKITGLQNCSDLEPAVKYCQDENELQMFDGILREYLVCYQNRIENIERALKDTHVVLKGDNLLELKSDEGHAVAHLCLNIQFLVGEQGWTESWMCKFTELGLKAATSCNLPKEIIKNGFYEDWSIGYCIKTLAKVASLASQEEEDESRVEYFKTPRVGAKSHHYSTPVNGKAADGTTNNDDTVASSDLVCTPLNSQSHKPRQRRI